MLRGRPVPTCLPACPTAQAPRPKSTQVEPAPPPHHPPPLPPPRAVAWRAAGHDQPDVRRLRPHAPPPPGPAPRALPSQTSPHPTPSPPWRTPGQAGPGRACSVLPGARRWTTASAAAAAPRFVRPKASRPQCPHRHGTRSGRARVAAPARPARLLAPRARAGGPGHCHLAAPPSLQLLPCPVPLRCRCCHVPTPGQDDGGLRHLCHAISCDAAR